jgi:virulence factor
MSPWDDHVIDTDVVMDLMIHDIDLITDLVGCDISTVYNSGRKLKNNSGFFDYYTAILEFKNGVIGKLTASRVTEQKIREIKVTAEKKYFEADLLKKELSIYSRIRFENLGDCLYKQENIIEKVNVPYNEPLYDEICDFRNCILKDTKPLVSGEDGLRALSNINLIMSSPEKSEVI